jgi:hypothetical protein
MSGGRADDNGCGCGRGIGGSRGTHHRPDDDVACGRGCGRGVDNVRGGTHCGSDDDVGCGCGRGTDDLGGSHLGPDDVGAQADPRDWGERAPGTAAARPPCGFERARVDHGRASTPNRRLRSRGGVLRSRMHRFCASGSAERAAAEKVAPTQRSGSRQSRLLGLRAPSSALLTARTTPGLVTCCGAGGSGHAPSAARRPGGCSAGRRVGRSRARRSR